MKMYLDPRLKGRFYPFTIPAEGAKFLWDNMDEDISVGVMRMIFNQKTKEYLYNRYSKQ